LAERNLLLGTISAYCTATQRLDQDLRPGVYSACMRGEQGYRKSEDGIQPQMKWVSAAYQARTRRRNNSFMPLPIRWDLQHLQCGPFFSRLSTDPLTRMTTSQ